MGVIDYKRLLFSGAIQILNHNKLEKCTLSRWLPSHLRVDIPKVYTFPMISDLKSVW